MILLTVTATLRSPVHVGAKNTAANFLAGLGYIPGRALLGAAAWAWIDEGGSPEAPEFALRFLSGAVCWGDLHPVPVDPSTGVAMDGVPTIVPRTVKVCKLFPIDHSEVDVLVTAKCAHECGYTIDGARCGVGLARREGAFVPQGDRSFRHSELRRQHRAHVAIGFDTGTARPGDLYSREVLLEGQVFRGQIHCRNEDTAEALRIDLQRLQLAVGRSRSRGYGQIDVQVEQGQPPSLSVDEITRCSRYIATVRKLAPESSSYFTLTAASAWALREPDGGYARSLTPQWLAHALGVDKANVRVLDGDARSEARSGWDGAAGLPIELRHVIVAGSTFLCSVAGVDDADLHTRLTAFLERGIGEHRIEGLGRVIINHPLHFTAEANRGN